MSRPHRAYSRNKRRSLIMLTMSSRFGKVIFVLLIQVSAWSHSMYQRTGTAHGFAARPNLTVPEVKAGYEGALEQTVAWFTKTL
jgi:hypothetical protein